MVEEVIKVEKNYILRLEEGIDIYFKQGIKLIKDSDKLEYERAFSNILKIYDLHKNQLYQSLINCNNDVFNIAKIFQKLISNDSFYPYVIYPVEIVKLEKFITKYKKIFDKISNKAGATIGIDIFLCEPFQRLTKYQILFKEIINQLDFHDTALRKFSSICRLTERQLTQLINVVDQAIIIKDLEKCSDIEWRENGKFRKASIMQIFNYNENVSYDANVYLFESCLIINQRNENEGNIFRTIINLDDIIYVEECLGTNIRLKMRRNEIVFSGNKSEIQEWMKELGTIHHFYGNY